MIAAAFVIERQGAIVTKRVFVTSDRIGSANPELGALLMKNFIYSMARADNPPKAVHLMNDGVRLACRGSASIDDLGMLVSRGVAVRSCGTCLDYLGLTQDLAVGEVGTMPDAVNALLSDDTLTVA
jgi:selenium metabolism protein YedF